MSVLLAPPDVEVAVVAILTGALPGAHVGTRYPADDALKVVRVSATGGDVSGRVHATARVLVECWADDEGDAFRLAAKAHAHLSGAQGRFGDVTVYRVEPLLPVNNPDVNRLARFRFQFLSTVYARMEALNG